MPDQSPVQYISEQMPALAETAMKLVSVDTQNPPGETDQLANIVTRRLDDLGLKTERVSVDPAKPNVLATLPGHTDTTLLYNGHFDTVPYNAAEWSYDPLGERDGDRLYGRGMTDMKGQLAAMLQTAAAFTETGTTPPVTLQFLFVSDEETGGAAGLSAVLEQHEFTADGCVIGETTCERGRHSITVADRGSIWLTLRASGVGAHGSRPMLGTNAIDRLYRAIEQIRTQFSDERLSVDPALEPILEESIEYYEQVMDAQAAKELFTRPTVNLGVIEGGESINSVPERATAKLDIRLTAGVDTSELLSRIRECVDGCDGVTIADVEWSVGTYEPIDSPLASAVTAAASAVIGDHVYRRSATGGGDAKTFRNAGIPTVEFGIGTDTVHAIDEYTTVDALSQNAAIYTQLPAVFADVMSGK